MMRYVLGRVGTNVWHLASSSEKETKLKGPESEQSIAARTMESWFFWQIKTKYLWKMLDVGCYAMSCNGHVLLCQWWDIWWAGEPSRYSHHHCQPWGEDWHTGRWKPIIVIFLGGGGDKIDNECDQPVCRRSCAGEQDCIWQSEDHGPLVFLTSLSLSSSTSTYMKTHPGEKPHKWRNLGARESWNKSSLLLTISAFTCPNFYNHGLLKCCSSLHLLVFVDKYKVLF